MKRFYLLCLLMALLTPWVTIQAQEVITLNDNISRALTIGSTYAFYDSGGSSSAYGTNQNYTATFTSDGYITIKFSSFATEFSSGCSDWDHMHIYDGDANTGTLLVRGQTGCSTNLSLKTDYTATSGTMTIVWQSDNSSTAAGWEAEIKATIPPACPKPTGLAKSNVTTNSADIAWTAGGSETAWTLEYSLDANFPEGETTSKKVNGTPSYHLTGLTPATKYYVHVIADCGANGESDESSSISFLTECANLTIDAEHPWSENFNGLTSGIPVCWDNSEGTTTSDSYKWSSNASGHEGRCVRFNSYSNSNGNTNILKTPTFEVSQALILSFWYKNPAGGDFSVFYAIGEQTGLLVEGLTGQADWVQKEIVLPPACVGHNVVIMFQGTSNWGSDDAYIYLDDVEMSIAPACEPLASISISNIERLSMIVNLNPQTGLELGDNYELVYATTALDDAALEAASKTPVTAASYTLDNLERETTYYVYVRANCGSEGSSTWVSASATTKGLVEDCSTSNTQILRTGDESSKVDYVAWGSFYKRYHTQQIYTADELTAAGLSAGYITRVAFQYALTTSYTKTVTLYMGLTTDDAFANTYFATLTAVSAPMEITFNEKDQWYEIELTNPIYWDGTSNVIVGALSVGSNYPSNGTTCFYGGTTNNYRAIYSRADDSNPSMTDGTRTYNRADVRFTICPPAKACPEVTNLSHVQVGEGKTEARIEWEYSGADYLSGFELVRSEIALDDPSSVQATELAANVTSIEYNDLAEGTHYYIYVRAICSHDDGESGWESIYFKTNANCAAQNGLNVEQTALTTVQATWNKAFEDQEDAFWYILSETELNEESFADAEKVSVTTNLIELSGLTNGQTYYLYVAPACATALSDYISTSFDIPASCQPVTALTAVRTQHNLIELSWASAEFATETQWEVGIVGQEGSQPVSERKAILFGLTPATAYQVYVKAKCSSTDISDATVLDVTTADMPSPCMQIGNGSGTTYYFPVNNYYKYSYSQQIFDASELQVGTINAISFQYSYGMAMTGAADVTIYMGITSKSEFSSTSDWVDLSELTEVYNGTLNCSQGWNEFTLTTPFNYDGSGNLVLAVHDNTTVYDGSNYTFYYTSGTVNKTLYYQNDYTACPADAPVAGTLSMNRNNTKFCFEPKACPDVTALAVSDITKEGATVSWEPMGTENAWNVFISDTKVTDFSNVSTVAVSTLSITFEGKDDDTDYFVYVQPKCGGTDFSEISFRTIATCKKMESPAVVDESEGSHGAQVTWVDPNENPAGNYVIAYGLADVFDLENAATYATANSATIPATLEGLDSETQYAFAVKADCGDNHISRWSDVAMFTTKPSCYAPDNFGVGTITHNSAVLAWEDSQNSGATYIVAYGEADAFDIDDADTYTLTEGIAALSKELTGLTPATEYKACVKSDCGNVNGQSKSWSEIKAFKTAYGVPFSEAFGSSVPADWARYSGLLNDVMSGSASLATTTSGWSFGAGNDVFDNHAKVNIFGTSCKYWLATPVVYLTDATAQLTFNLALTAYSGNVAASGTRLDDKFVVVVSTDNGETWSILREWNNSGSEDVYNDIPLAGTEVAINLNDYIGQGIKLAFYGESTVTSNGDNNLHIDNVSIDIIPDCALPTGLAVSDITANGATFTWDAVEGGKWQYAYKLAADVEPADGEFTAIGTNIFTIESGLQDNTDYIFYLRQDCNSAMSEIVTIPFHTLMQPEAVPYATDFESGNDWMFVNGSQTNAWAYGEAAHNGEGTHALYISNDGGEKNEYTLNSTTVAYAVKLFSFEEGKYSFTYDWIADGELWSGSPCDYLRVLLAPESAELTAGSLFSGLGATTVPTGWIALDGTQAHQGSAVWKTRVTEDMDIAAGYYKVVLVWRNDGSSGNNPPAAVDNFSIAKVNCPKPTGLSVPDETLFYNSAEVSIEAADDATSAIHLQYKAADDAEWTLVENITIPHKLENLATGTTYLVRVQAVCNNGVDLGDWTEPIDFTPVCKTPTLLASGITATTNSATIAWTAKSGEEAWNIQYKKSAETEWSTVSNVEENPYTLEGLAPGTTYQVKVAAAVCQDATYTSEVSFNTECENITAFPWSENFNGLTSGIPNCWDNSEGTTTTASYKWSSYASGHEGKGLRFNSFNNSEDNTNILKTPTIEVSQALVLSFWYKNPTGGDFSVFYAIDGELQTDPLASGLTGQADWIQKEILLPEACIGKNVMILFQGTSNWGSGDAYIYLDDVEISIAPDCEKPTAVAASDITTTDATIAWNAGDGQTAWQICLNDDMDNLIDADSNPFALTGLAARTDYSVKVRANCGSSYSDWSNAASFATAICEDTYKKAIRYELTDSYGDGWNGNAIRVVHKATGIEVASLTIPANNSSNNGTLDLCCGEEYSFNWVAGSFAQECSFVIYDIQGDEIYKFEKTSTGPTAGLFKDYVMACPSCLKPTAVEVPAANITSSSALVQWTAAEGQNAWQICLNGDETNLIDVDNNPPFTLTELASAADYSVKVRANCGNDGYSAWSETVNFSTVAACQTPDGLAASNITAASAVIDWNTYSQTGFNLRYRKAGEEDWETMNNVAQPCLIDGLEKESNYEVQVQVACDNPETWSATYSFKTAYGVPFSEAFGSSVPADWARYSGLLNDVMSGSASLATTTSGWSFGTGNNVFDNHAKVNIFGTSCKYWLATPVVYLTDATAQLTFDLAQTAYSGNGAASGTRLDDRFVVVVSTDNGETWSILREWNNSGSQDVYNNIPVAGTEVAINLNAYIGQGIKLAFYGESTVTNNGDNNLHIDNVMIDVIPSCPKPTNLAPADVIYNAATLSWTAGASESAWELQYSTSQTDWSQAVVLDNITATSINLSDLTPGTTYYARVRAICGDNDESEWSQIVSFTPQCIAPTFGADAITDITTTSATITWNAGNGENEWTLKYKKASETVWTEEPVATNSYSFSALTAGTTYQVKVAAVCGTESAVKTFDTECETITSFPYSENFDGITGSSFAHVLPACWSYINTSSNTSYNIYPMVYYYSYTNYANSTPNTLRFYSYSYSDPQDQYAILPEMDGISGLRMRFNARAYSSSYPADFIVGVMSDPTDASTFVPVASKEPAGTSFEAMEVRFDTYAGAGKHIAIKMLAATSYYRGLFIDDIIIDQIPDCEEASGLAVVANSITASGASFTWDADGGAWKYAYALASEAEPEVENYIAISENSVELSGLTDNSDYIFYLRSDCGTSVSPSISVPFQTEQLAVAVGNAWSDDFESGKQWKFINSSNHGWALGEAAHNGDGSHAMYVSTDNGSTNSYNNGSTNIVYATKLFNFQQGQYIFQYDWKAKGEGASYDWDYLRVALVPATVALAAGVVPGSFSQNSLPAGWIALDGGSLLNLKTDWQTVTTNEMTIAEASYMVVFAWKNDGSQGDNPPAAIDNFSITKLHCIAPTALTASAASANSILLSWTQGNEETAWNAQYRIGSGDWTTVALTDAAIAGSACSAMLNGLEPQTTYEIRVQADCDDTQSSWSASAQATTLCATEELPFSEDFNGLASGIPECWNNDEVEQVSGTAKKWAYYANGHEGKCVRFDSYTNKSGNVNYLKTPAVAITDDAAVLRFWYKNPDGGDFSVLCSLDGVLQDAPLASGLTAAADWTEMNISLAACAGHNAVIIFKGTSNYAEGDNIDAYIYLDDIRISRVLTLADDAINTDLLEAAYGSVADVTIGRTIPYDIHFSTICLPFDLPTLDGTPLEGGELWTFKYSKKDETSDSLLVRIIPAESIEAGMPYFIAFPDAADNSGANDIVNPIFENVTISATVGQKLGDEAVSQFCAILDKPEPFAAGDQTKLFLADNNKLHWWNGTYDSQLNSFRAFFKVNVGSGNNAPIHHGMPVRIIKDEKIATGIGETDGLNADINAQKILENDHVVIIRNGVKYSIQGQVISK